MSRQLDLLISPRSTSSAEGSPARTSPPQATVRASPGADLVYFGSCTVSFARWHPESSSWRTSQLSVSGEAQRYAGRWPTSGMICAGVAYPQPRWAHLISVSGGSALGGEGLAWPTPTCQAAKHGPPTDWEMSSGRNGIWIAVEKWPTPNKMDCTDLSESPESFDARRARLKAKHSNGNGAGRVLAVEARRWPTPGAADNRDRGDLSMPCIQRRIEQGRQIGLSMMEKGSLSPDWVEPLMGFPPGWTLTDGPPLRDHSTPGSHPEPDPASPTTETDSKP